MNEPATQRRYKDVVLQLTEKIDSGEFPDGSLLPSERQLTDMFGVSRTAVREAMVSLQESGLISVRPPNRRALVTRVDDDGFFKSITSAAQSLLKRQNGMADFQEARALFESGLARHAARYAPPKEIERLAIALEQNRKAIDDPESFAMTSLEFHRILAEIPRNSIFSACQSALVEWVVKIRQDTVNLQGRTREMSLSVYKKREAIYQAIAAHDVEAADKAVSNYLDTVNALYWKAKESITEKTK